MYQNLATGQQLNTCDFFAYISSINWCSCTTDEVWLGNGVAKSGYDWFIYFQSNTPTCADQAPTCMAVQISDADQPGETLYVLNFPAIGIPTPTKTYQWEQSLDGITWSGIATGSSLLITTAMVGKYIRVRGEADNGVGSPSVCYSGAVPIVPANASPTNTIAPVISGGTTQGSILTCTTGTWDGFPTPSFSYVWYSNGQQVGTGNTYTLSLHDSTKNITCVVTANNGINPNGTAISNTITAGYFIPQLVSSPILSGNTTLGSQLTCTTGVWSGTNITYDYQWYSNGNPVGDNSAQYQLQITDSMSSIFCIVTATNPAGYDQDTSNTITAGDYSPVNIVPPTISVVGGGIPNVGAQLTCSVGTWQGGNITYSYQWYRGATPVGTNSSLYTIVTGDTGASMTCVVTATNLGGSASATSNNINVPSGPGVSAPSNSTPPSIAVAGGGNPIVGATIVAQVGVWNGTSPITYTYEWFSGVTSVGTDAYYVLQSSDYGEVITCQVTATNAYGTDTATSNSITGVSIPVNLTAPVVSGTAIVGNTLTTTDGTWSGNSPITFDYTWYRGNTSVGTNSPSYTLVSADLGELIYCVVTANNAYGGTNAQSNLKTCEQAPVNTSAPVIYGNNTPGSILSVELGDWDAYPAISSYSYNWQYSTNGGVSWTNLGATGATYTITTTDIGRLIRCQLTATNSIGSGSADTNNELIDSVPLNTIAPVISGTLLVGNTLSTTDGTWTGSGTITYSYRWLRNGVAISGATSNTYTSVSADAGKNITCEVTATNSIGPNRIVSNALVPTIAPTMTAGPIIYGSYLVGQTLSVENGYYSAYPAVTITRKWQYSSDGGSTWNDYSPSQTGTTYTLVSGDSGKLVRVLESATNSIGSPVTSASNSASITTLVVQRPDNTIAPVVSGTPSIGSVLTTTNGTWANTPTSYAYQWLRSGSAISGATSSTYTLVSADTNLLITCRVTATNAGGSEFVSGNEIYAYDASFYAVVTFATAQGYTLPTTAQQQKFSQLVKELKDNSMWSNMDRFFWMANNGSSNFALINWVSPSVGTLLSLVNTPTWTSNVGFISTGTSYIDTQYNPSTQGVNYTLNNAGRYCFITQRATASGQINIDGANTNTNRNVMYVATGQNNHHINQDTNTGSGINTSCNGYHSITRTGASTSSRGTDLQQSLNIASTSIFNGNQHIMRSAQVAAIAGNGYGFYAIGAGMSDADVATHRSIIRKYINNL